MADEKVMTIGELEEILKAAPDKTLPIITDSGYCYNSTELKDDALVLIEYEREYAEIMADKEDEKKDENKDE